MGPRGTRELRNLQEPSIWDAPRPDVAKEEGRLLRSMVESSQDNANIAMDEFFGDIALVAKDPETMVDTSSDTSGYDYKSRNGKGGIREHPIAILDKLMDDNLHGLSKSEHSKQMKDVVMELRKDGMPQRFRDAWDHPDPKVREKWRKGIKLEFKKMNERKVWRKIKKSEIPQDRQCIKNKWVFEIKRNGLFRCRLVACGYSQIPGVDFTESYSPVIHDVTWRVLIILLIARGYYSMIIDIETVFLYRYFEDGEKIYMNCPDGMTNEQDECLELLKTIYGLVQASRQSYKKFIKSLKLVGFQGGLVDPCLMVKRMIQDSSI